MQAPQNGQSTAAPPNNPASFVPTAAAAAAPAPMANTNFTMAAAATQQPPPQQQPAAQQANFQQGVLNGGWHSDKDYESRREMIKKIVLLLQQRKPNAPTEWLKKLPQMAKRLEESLYRSAKSFDEYNNSNTLKHRLQQLAVSIGKKTRNLQAAQSHQRKLQQQLQQQQQAQVAAPVAPQVVNMSDINPMMAAAPTAAAAAPVVQQVQYPPVVQQQPQQLQQQQQVVQPQVAQPAVAAQPAAPAAAAAAPANGRPVSDRQQVLRHQQQRLLLLRHAAKCQHEDGKCPVTPHCAGMKRLWKHIAECKNQKCVVPHCVSSRYVLSHYHRCKDVRCPVCGPVREAIHRSHEKQKHMQALKQRHAQAVQQTTTTTAAAGTEPPPKRAKVDAAVKPGGLAVLPSTGGPKPQEDHTLINCFSVDQIQRHIDSLNNGLVLSPTRLKTKGMEVLSALQSHQHAWVFNAPVDPVELGLPDYFQVIKHPMDLGTVRKKLENGVYTKLEQFEAHVVLTFDNAMLYNPEGSVVYNMANDMKLKFEADFKALLTQLNAEEDKKRRNGEACSLCGCEKLLFEPPIFYCNGMQCPSKRIRRNSYYYVAGNTNQHHWCQQCFQDLREGPIDLGGTTIQKEGMIKKKNDEVHEESWVQCDRCVRWVHQICALFNTRQNKDQQSEFACPRCTIAERKSRNALAATSSTPMAEDLPRTKLSEFLEHGVREKVEEFWKKEVKSIAEKEGITAEEAEAKVDRGGTVTIRQVASMDRKVEVLDRTKKRYKFKNYPEEFNYRCKCIIVFQNIDGVDVLLFGLYVYEHDDSNPAPNTRSVYISYLDSVHYMTPRSMRTFVYHEILISYLDYVRRRGFSTAHIWACPPVKGDDYILYAKPEDQKIPKEERLRQWYYDMLDHCQRRGIVGKVTNVYDLYFSDPKCDATVVPYMEGDYFPGEVENIIKNIEEGKAGKKSGSKGGSKDKDKKAKQKKKSGRGGTRSAGLDEEALKASGLMPEGVDPKSLEAGARDYVMVKLGETIQPMKEGFIVAYLAWSGAKEEHMVVPKAIQEHRDQHNITWKLPNPEPVKVEEGAEKEAAETKPEGAAASAATSADATDAKPSSDAPTPMEVDSASAKAPETDVKTEETTSTATAETNPQSGSAEGEKPAATAPAAEPSVANTDAATAEPATTTTTETSASAPAPVVSTDPAPTTSTDPAPAADASGEVKQEDTEAQKAAMAIRVGKFAAMARKRDLSGEPKVTTEKKPEAKDKPEEEDAQAIMVKDSKGCMVKVLDDDKDDLDSEILNTRQDFLTLCQGNHYQYDQLRRAKHSSMMVLWHLHNRDAPKFVQQCVTCSREILTGYRFRCSVCPDVDQCQDCHRDVARRHPHHMKPIPVASNQSEAQRKERQRSVQLHMALLQHAATCNSPKCQSTNCTKMKGLLKHGNQCKIKATGGCNVCKRIWALLQIHARQCKAKTCPVPSCMAIRERVRQLKRQQQAMDDRRRQEMNRVYRGKR